MENLHMIAIHCFEYMHEMNPRAMVSRTRNAIIISLVAARAGTNLFPPTTSQQQSASLY